MQLTRSNAAIFCFFSADDSCCCPEYFPTIRVLLTIRQARESGFFWERGVKKFAAGFSEDGGLFNWSSIAILFLCTEIGSYL